MGQGCSHADALMRLMLHLLMTWQRMRTAKTKTMLLLLQHSLIAVMCLLGPRDYLVDYGYY